MPPFRTTRSLSFLSEAALSDGHGRAVDRAGAQGRDAGLLVGKRLQRDRVHVREALLPEVLVGHQLDAVVRVEADHPVRAGADGVAADVDLVVETGRNDRRVAAPREEAEDTRVTRLQVEPRDVLRDDVDAEEGRHLADRRDAARQRRVQHHLDRVLHVARVELLAVVELDALAQVERDRLLVGRDLPRRGQRRLEVQVPVPLDERVVRRLLAPVVRGQDRPERRNVDRVLLERPDEPAAVLGLRRRRTWTSCVAAAFAVPANEPAATAPAATTPAFTSASRRVTPPLTALSGVSLSDTARPSFRARRSEDLTDPGSLTLDVVIEDGLAHLNVCEPVHGLAIDLDPEPRRERRPR